MPAKIANFIIVFLSDQENYGFDEHTLPTLVRLVDLSEPDFRSFSHTGVGAFYLSSSRSRERVEMLLEAAKTLKDKEEKFKSLGFGTSEGRCVAEFTWFGRVKRNGTIPLGEAVNVAARNAMIKTEPVQSANVASRRGC